MNVVNSMGTQRMLVRGKKETNKPPDCSHSDQLVPPVAPPANGDLVQHSAHSEVRH